MKDSKFNTEDKKKAQEKTRTYIASAADVDGSNYENEETTSSSSSSTVDGEIAFSELYCGDDIPDRFS